MVRTKAHDQDYRESQQDRSMVFPTAQSGRNGKSIMSSAKILHEWRSHEWRSGGATSEGFLHYEYTQYNTIRILNDRLLVVF